MPTDLLDQLKAMINNSRSTGAENANSPYENTSLLASVAPPIVPHAINPAGCHESLSGMENFESGTNSQFLSWINGNGPFVPQPLPVDDLLLLDDGFPPLSHGPPTDKYPVTRFEKVLAFQYVFTNKSSTNRSSTNEEGTCIWSDGTHPWSGEPCRIKWVAVHGMHSICVVTRNEDLVREVGQCMSDFDGSKEDYLEVFRQGVISIVEDLADKMFGKSSKKPFGFVSVIPGTQEGSSHEASSAEYNEEKAIKFLQDEMKSNTAFTYDKTVQTAILAFQHLFCRKFKANEIRVIVRKEDGGNRNTSQPAR